MEDLNLKEETENKVKKVSDRATALARIFPLLQKMDSHVSTSWSRVQCLHDSSTLGLVEVWAWARCCGNPAPSLLFNLEVRFWGTL